jgi:hypothetical protein
MTIAHDVQPGSGFEDPRGGRLGDAESPLGQADAVPFAIRAERLARQVQYFERAGYVLETASALQAVVARPVGRRALRSALLVIATAGLYLVPLALGSGRTYHRVAITVDRSGSVRMS